jgi:uncharacterized protein
MDNISANNANSATSAHVTALNLFPVRSCAGISSASVHVSAHGLLLDRQWRLIGADGDFLTQRECPPMALIRPSIEKDKLCLRFAAGDEADVCQVALRGENQNTAGEGVRISESCRGIDQGDAVAAWLHKQLGRPARLLRVTDASAEQIVRGSAGSADFARPDMSPVLIISEASLTDLNSRLDTPVKMNRFRPNIVVSGIAAYEEETWSEVTIGGVKFVASSEPCGRCSLINIDQERGEKAGKEPLKTLARYRRSQAGPVIFGKYMVPVNVGVINLHDEVSSRTR